MTTPKAHSFRRPALGAALAGAVVGLPLALLPTGAADATTYAYWSYWHKRPGSTSWTYSGSGPYSYRPADGSVEGWHFVTGSGGPSDPPPRARGAYSSLCPTSSGAAGVQVALILDFGSSVRKACLTVPSGSTGSTVLTTAGARPRYDSSGLLCSISGYPPRGCGQVVASSTPTPAPSAPPSTATRAPSAPRTTADAPGPAGTSSGSRSGRTAGTGAAAAAGAAGAPTRTAGTATTAGPTAPAGTAGTTSTAGPTATATGSGSASPSATRSGDTGAAASSAASPEESFAPIAQQGGSDSGAPVGGLLAGGAAILAVATAAVVQARRRRAG